MEESAVVNGGEDPTVTITITSTGHLATATVGRPGNASAATSSTTTKSFQKNRKRRRSEGNEDATNNSLQHQIRIHPLELDGKLISDSTWIRVVEPYPYTFQTFAKARWVGRTVLDVYSTEFGSYPKSYYESAISQGRIMVSNHNVSLDYQIKGGDLLSHTVHRHEPGVAVSLPEPPYIRIIQDTSTVLVVDKPGTLPIHPCGGYHVQSLMNLLEPHFGKLYTIHRLDRLTSGLVILGKTTTIATEWGKAIMNRDCEKVYLARVAGKFPLQCPNHLPRLQATENIPGHGEYSNVSNNKETIQTSSIEAIRKRNAYGYWITNGIGIVQPDLGLPDVFASQHDPEEWLDGSTRSTCNANDFLWIHLACPTRISNPKDGICEAGPFVALDDGLYQKTVKPAETSFGVIRYDEATDSTVVICRPMTGRTHQIRLHLQHLGHAIANDPNYGGEIWYGNPKGKEACRIAQDRLDAIASSNQFHNDNEMGQTSNEETRVDTTATSTIDVPATESEIQEEVSTAVRQENENVSDFIQRTCVWCARSRNSIGNTPRNVLEFLVRSPGIWLHAFQYSFQDCHGASVYRFRCPPPDWV